MPFSSGSISTPIKIGILALGWLFLISALHFFFNYEETHRVTIRMGYMPVVTNLAAPILDYATKDQSGIRFEALKFSSFSEMGESLRHGNIEAAFIIAPLSIVLHQQQAGIKVVYIGNRHESTFVCRNDLKMDGFSSLSGKSIAVPLRYSGHNLAVRELARKYEESGFKLNVVEMNPPDMPSALASGALDAYFVGEPFAAKSVYAGNANVVYYVEQICPNFICNLLIVKDDFIQNYPDRVRILVQAAVRSGLWASQNRDEAANIAAQYWNQPVNLVNFAMNTPPDRIVFDKYLPIESELQSIANAMVSFGLSTSNDVAGLIDDRWAKNANTRKVTDFSSILKTDESN